MSQILAAADFIRCNSNCSNADSYGEIVTLLSSCERDLVSRLPAQPLCHLMVNLFKMAFNELSMQCIDLFLDNFCIDLKGVVNWKDPS